MSPRLLHIFGPLYIHSYGVWIVIGLLITLWLSLKDPRREKLISIDLYFSVIGYSIIAGVIGAKVLFIIDSLSAHDSLWEACKPWNGGGSVLGAVIGLLFFIPLYLRNKSVAILPFLDFIAIYTPLLHSISRIGCFFAGCCYGNPTMLPWATMYTHPDCSAPLDVYVHPTQLYSSIALLALFFLLYRLAQRTDLKSGLILCFYLFGESIERFFVDFLRADRQFFSIKKLTLLSINQWVALLIFAGTLLGFIRISQYTKQHESI